MRLQKRNKEEKIEVNKKKEKLFPVPRKKRENHETLKVNLLPQSTETPSKKGRLFHNLGEDGRKPPFASEGKRFANMMSGYW